MGLTLDNVTEIVRECGNYALKRLGARDVSVKQDGTLVTNLDLQIERLIADRLLLADPTLAILGEECKREPVRPGQRLAVVDPIDGTSNLVRGSPYWAVSVGIAKDGILELGAIYAPKLNGLWVADADGAWYNERELSMTSPAVDRNFRLGMPGRWHAFQLDRSFPGTTRSYGSTALQIALLASGELDAVVIRNAHYAWDILGGMRIALSAGAVFSVLSGGSVIIDRLLTGQPVSEPIIGAHPSVIEVVRQSIHWQCNEGGE